MHNDRATYPEDLRYSREHGWVRADVATVTCGITWHAQDQLGDIVGVRLPVPGDRLVSGVAYVTIESIKTVFNVVAPVSGVVIASNGDLEAEPELLNFEPYDRGWLVVVAVAEGEPIGDLQDATRYRAMIDSA